MWAQHTRGPRTHSPQNPLAPQDISERKVASGVNRAGAADTHSKKPHIKKASEGQAPTIRYLGVSFPVFMNKIKSYIFEIGNKESASMGGMVASYPHSGTWVLSPWTILHLDSLMALGAL